ncbi:carbohydrate ABC transporter permease [Brachybacterium sp. YJGR34]|uniref:carbohydrate ABC transporter permease n=1 Tax=Brachybacterium sp. YJGR34 TaxID=2059911 RepID=UPI000E0B1409|nr:carbohydrate ABC transporter permease [Brachybacterium sp. YJGR34]
MSATITSKTVTGRMGRWATSAVLLLISIATVYPFVWMILTSLRESNSVFGGPFIPERITLDAYSRVLEFTGFVGHYWNSLWMTTVTCAVVLALSTLCGYAFAKLRFPFKNALYVVLLSTLMMPGTALIIPVYLQLRTFGLLDSQLGLIIVYASGAAPFSMFLMRAFFESLPDELVQAARVDGAGELLVFLRVVLPLARPGIATVVIFQFLATWNEFLMANTVLQTPDKLPLQPILFSLQGQYSTDWTTLCAGLALSAIPVVLVYVFLQRQFIAGMTLGAVKN